MKKSEIKPFRYIIPFKAGEKQNGKSVLVQLFQCGSCGEIYDNREDAVSCVKSHNNKGMKMAAADKKENQR